MRLPALLAVFMLVTVAVAFGDLQGVFVPDLDHPAI